MKRTTVQVRGWANDRNIILGSTAKAQQLKCVEESSEVFEAIQLADQGKFIDAVGDTLVVLTIQCAQLGYDADDILATPATYENPLFIPFENTPHSLEMYKLVLSLGIGMGALSGDLARDRDAQFSMRTIVRTLRNMCAVTNVNVKSCYEFAYGEIKHRKGRMIDGVYVKEIDLPN